MPEDRQRGYKTLGLIHLCHGVESARDVEDTFGVAKDGFVNGDPGIGFLLKRRELNPQHGSDLAHSNLVDV